MQSGKTVTGGVVLRVTDTKETDRILTVLTADRGKIPLIARGARRKNSRLAAACQMPAYSELTIFKRGSWYMLDEASPIELFDGLGRDIELLALAAWFCELTEAVCAEETPCPEILSLLLNALYALCRTGKDPRLVKAAFQFRLMALSGFEPLAEECAVCGTAQPEGPVLDISGGFVACGTCRGPERSFRLPLTEAGLAALRHVLYADTQAAVQLYAGAGRPAGAGSGGRGVYRRPAGARVPDAGLLQGPVGITGGHTYMSELFEKSIRTLELPAVLELLARHAVSDEAKARCLRLRPATDAAAVEHLLDETDAAKTRLGLHGSPSFAGVKDVSQALDRADHGGVLNTRELLDVAGVLTAARRVSDYDAERQGEATAIDRLFSALHVQPLSGG